MLQLQALVTLGGANRDWFKARHGFVVDSQGNHTHAQLGNLVVWNDDEIAPHSGFPMHGHRDMEIVTYVREGVLQHEDSSGGRGEIGARNVQVITAGHWNAPFPNTATTDAYTTKDLSDLAVYLSAWTLIRVGPLNPWPICSARVGSCQSRAHFPKTKMRCGLRPTLGGHFAALEQPELFVAELRKSLTQFR